MLKMKELIIEIQAGKKYGDKDKVSKILETMRADIKDLKLRRKEKQEEQSKLAYFIKV